MTKQMLADYYWAIAEHMLPHIAYRPISLVRCPDGAAKPCFYQKHVSGMLPKDIGTVMISDKKTGKPEPYITLNTREALAGLAQMSVLEIHPWGSRNEDLEHADRVIFDLDPDESLSWSAVTEAAHDVRRRLKKLALESFVKTTGGKGLHIVIGISPQHDWNTIKVFSHHFVLAMEKAAPSRYLSKMTKAARAGKIYLDYLRNERGSTSVAPYSPRSRAGGPVSMPLAWSELKAHDRPVFRVADFPSWRERLKRDPWSDLSAVKQELTADAMRSVGIQF
jgi:bifunctional non-homologous end joining protein LigD